MTNTAEIPEVTDFIEGAIDIIAAAIKTAENGEPFHDSGTYVNMSASLMFSLVIDRMGMTEEHFADALERYDSGEGPADVEIGRHDA